MIESMVKDYDVEVGKKRVGIINKNLVLLQFVK